MLKYIFIIYMANIPFTPISSQNIGLISPIKTRHFAKSFTESKLQFLYEITSDIAQNDIINTIIPLLEQKNFDNLPKTNLDNETEKNPITIQKNIVKNLLFEIKTKIDNRKDFTSENPIIQNLDCLEKYERITDKISEDYLLNAVNILINIPLYDASNKNEYDNKTSKINSQTLKDLLNIDATLRIFLLSLDRQEDELYNLFKNITSSNIRNKIKKSKCINNNNSTLNFLRVNNCEKFKTGILCDVNILNIHNILMRYEIVGTILDNYVIETKNTYSKNALNIDTNINLQKIYCKNKILNINYNCKFHVFLKPCEKALNDKNIKNIAAYCPFLKIEKSKNFQKTFFFTIIYNGKNKLFKNDTFIAPDQNIFGISTNKTILIKDNVNKQNFSIQKTNAGNFKIHTMIYSDLELASLIETLSKSFLADIPTDNFIYVIYSIILMIMLYFIAILAKKIKQTANRPLTIVVNRRLNRLSRPNRPNNL